MTDPRCTVLSAGLEEPLAGTAPHGVGWIALEQPGPWGAKAWTASRLDPDLGRRVEAACEATPAPVRPVLVRRPDGSAGEARTLLVAHTVPGATWLLAGAVDPGSLHDVAWEDLAAAAATGDRSRALALLPGAASSEPVLLVCTNGKRDRCCSIEGRPVALAATAARPGRVWEATHLGGHRFAPTSVVLPTGLLHGRVTPRSALDLLDAADTGRVVLERARGRSTWPPEAQVAELAVRALLGETAADAVHVVLGADAPVVDVAGRRWRVPVTRTTAPVERPESCGKAAVPLVSWEAGPPERLG